MAKKKRAGRKAKRHTHAKKTHVKALHHSAKDRKKTAHRKHVANRHRAPVAKQPVDRASFAKNDAKVVSKKPPVSKAVHPPKKSVKLRKSHKAMHAKHEKAENLYVKTGIKGFDDLLERGIRKGSTVLLSGGAGSGKTILGLQILANAAKRGEKGLYMSFEENEERLREHMRDFGWDAQDLEKKRALMIKKLNIFDIGRSLDALMAKSEGELLIDIKPIIMPSNFKPDYVVLDSLTAVASVFSGKESYRAYVENLFEYFREIDVTAFLITETEEVPSIFSPKGVDEFLADGVVVLYNVRKGDIRERAVEVLKMRGTKHTGKVVAMRIDKSGIEIYPDQEVFGNIR